MVGSIVGTVLVLTLPLPGCGSNGRTGTGAGPLSVRALVSKLRSEGVVCKLLEVKEIPSTRGALSEAEEARQPREYGFCALPGAPRVNGKPFATEIRVFDDDRHLQYLPAPEGVPDRISFVYGHRWEIYVVPARGGDEVRDALGGRSL